MGAVQRDLNLTAEFCAGCHQHDQPALVQRHEQAVKLFGLGAHDNEIPFSSSSRAMASSSCES